jgi:hypothetical protein
VPRLPLGPDALALSSWAEVRGFLRAEAPASAFAGFALLVPSAALDFACALMRAERRDALDMSAALSYRVRGVKRESVQQGSCRPYKLGGDYEPKIIITLLRINVRSHFVLINSKNSKNSKTPNALSFAPPHVLLL